MPYTDCQVSADGSSTPRHAEHVSSDATLYQIVVQVYIQKAFMWTLDSSASIDFLSGSGLTLTDRFKTERHLAHQIDA